MKVTVDSKTFDNATDKALSAIDRNALSAINDVASEILRLGTFEVPFDTGMLQASGHVEPDTDKRVIVGYNRVYAARLHEHPEYRFQNGRKGKYLEDPIKNNLSIFQEYIKKAVTQTFQ